jgi:hypothetical protein
MAKKKHRSDEKFNSKVALKAILSGLKIVDSNCIVNIVY